MNTLLHLFFACFHGARFYIEVSILQHAATHCNTSVLHCLLRSCAEISISIQKRTRKSVYVRMSHVIEHFLISPH